MLYKSEIDLKNQLLDFIKSSNQLYIFSAYIKRNALEYLINNTDNVKSICVRWEARDLITEVSDLEIYPYLKDKGIALYRNPRLHLKAFVDDYRSCFMGSANISNRALAILETSNHNYEIATTVKNLTFEDRLYFNRIEQESILISDHIYNQLKEQLPQKKKDFPVEVDFKLKFEAPDKNYLISSLPMSFDIYKLFDIYSSGTSDDNVELNCAVHDLALYNIKNSLTEADFKASLKAAFFNHPFIQAFIKKVEERNEIYFGEAKAWIHENCADVPTPRRWEITTNIQILYRWIVELGEGKFKIDIPGSHSQRLYFD
jgi:hypothetical protein